MDTKTLLSKTEIKIQFESTKEIGEANRSETEISVANRYSGV